MNEREAIDAGAHRVLRDFQSALDMALPNARRELKVLPVACRFYGMNGMFDGQLVPTYGNQCGLISGSHSPCRMEIANETPDEKTCPLVLRVFGGPKPEGT